MSPRAARPSGQRLIGWANVDLAPGASQTVTVDADPRLLADWSTPRHRWPMPAGRYDVTVEQLRRRQRGADEVRRDWRRGCCRLDCGSASFRWLSRSEAAYSLSPQIIRARGEHMPKIRWLIIWLCFLANAISYIDRANLAIAAPAIRAELGIDAAAMGLVLSAFFWTYAVMQLPAGWFIDQRRACASAWPSR